MTTRLLGVAAVLLAAVLAGCGSDDSSTAPARPTAAAGSPSSTPSAPGTPEGWVPIADVPSGTAFALPSVARPQTRPASGGFVGRVYQVRDTDGVGVAVALEASDHDLTTFDVQRLVRAVVTGLEHSGATEVGLRDVRPVTSQGMTGFDSVISYVSTDGKKRAYWRVRALHDQRRVVELQALAFLDRDRTTSPAVDRDFQRLVGSFRVTG